MALVSIEFCIFLFSIILIYLIVPQFLKKYVIVFANIFFGICNGVRSFIGLVILCVFTFSDGLLIAKAKNKKAALIGGISVILIAFVFQRYAKEDLWIMVGLSFWGLQLISYLCDIYNKKYIPTHNFVDFFIYVSFFGNVTSGPIERADKILPQYNSLATNSKNIQHGIQLCLWGLMQKLILGERLAMVANTIFDNYVMYSGIEIIIGVFAYSLQIYCDFCGYSNIAVGVAEVFGLHIIENFKQPYFARTISEFWRRWHISLSQWLRDYIYIPLGGNKKSAVRKYLNIIIVFMISGIWHGNNATFLYWGGGICTLPDCWRKYKKNQTKIKEYL